jgi:hypothetical protein
MTSVESLIAVFQENLAATGSLDAALTTTLWIAYKLGLAEGRAGVPDICDDLEI